MTTNLSHTGGNPKTTCISSDARIFARELRTQIRRLDLVIGDLQALTSRTGGELGRLLGNQPLLAERTEDALIWMLLLIRTTERLRVIYCAGSFDRAMQMMNAFFGSKAANKKATRRRWERMDKGGRSAESKQLMLDL
jgi:hypothetical protein